MRKPLEAFLVCAALGLGACGGTDVCEKPKAYQASQPGKRIEAPDGMDPLNSAREMSIPDASPRDPRPEGSRCLELPPAYGSESGAPRTPAD